MSSFRPSRGCLAPALVSGPNRWYLPPGASHAPHLVEEHPITKLCGAEHGQDDGAGVVGVCGEGVVGGS